MSMDFLNQTNSYDYHFFFKDIKSLKYGCQIGTQNAIQNTTHDQDLGFGSKNPKTSKNIKNMYVEPCRQNYMNFGNSVI